ncbi:hypothetical protein [Actinoplanes friuliensis]|uniref:Uncharacterized protein n=1 Tax=Actinoplanes friuliensis DSM 7358 TaxID=1246995 RepID=U5W581_9ACTN|nr:hypothetical protein [Actinoplanes friuliensis]AGZ43066.1 hypothetical protein AFR_23990 [Actinoplanes friuliensis DSM 7358]
MTGFDLRPSRPIAIAALVVGALLLLFGIITIVRDGFSWFAVLWLGVAAFVLAGLTRRFWSIGPREGLRPPKAVAVLAAVLGVGIGVFGVLQFGSTDPVVTVIWVAALVCIIGGQLWSAFRPPR